MSGGARAALFDMDGTLLWLEVDIEPVRAALSELFAPAGFRERFSPILPTIERAAAAVGRSDSERRAWVRRGRGLIDAAEVQAAGRARPMPGAVAACGRLAGAIPCGLVTDNGRACVGAALRGAGFSDQQFEQVVTRDDVARSKPDPEGIVRAARALLPDGGTALWVGDSPRDVVAGHAARDVLRAGSTPVELDIVAVRGGRGADADLRAAAPDRLAERLDDAVAGLIH